MSTIELPVLKFDRKRTNAKQCPCGKNNSDGKFAPYAGFIDCGFCHSCGTNFLPEIEQTENHEQKKSDQIPALKKNKQTSYIAPEIFKASLGNHIENNFIEFLFNRFGAETTTKQIEKYFIGTSKHWSRSTVFWQIDENGKIRTGKIMQYNARDGKRIKEPYNHVAWAHKAIKQAEFVLQQCFFGQHLIKSNKKVVAIVESEKTAIIASIYLPQFVWLAVGGKENFSLNKLECLQGRNVVLFPDLNCYDLWKKKAKEFSSIANFSVSQLLELKANDQERKDGLDLADYLLRFDLSAFIQSDEVSNEYQTSSIEDNSLQYPFDYLPTISLQKFTQAIIEPNSNRSLIIQQIKFIGNTTEAKAKAIFKQMLKAGLIIETSIDSFDLV